MAAKQLSDGNGDGVAIGQTTTDKVGFFGTVTAAQQVCTASAALTAGETTPADIAAAFVELYAALKAYKLVG